MGPRRRVTIKDVAEATGLSPAAVSTLASELRLACMRISRRIRFESTHLVAPHQFSVLCRLQEAPRTPGELAEIEKVSAGSSSARPTPRTAAR